MPVYLYTMSKASAKKLKKKEEISMIACFCEKRIKIKNYRPEAKKINYTNLIRFLNHEKLHLILRDKVDVDSSLKLDNLEGTGKKWKISQY